MPTALYYPYANIRNESILKTGLMLWDKLEFISPWDGFIQESTDPALRRALEIFVQPFLPNKQIKAIVHEQVRQLVDSGLPEWFWVIPDDPDAQYQIYPRKFLEETWEVLNEAKFVKKIEPRLGNYRPRRIPHEYAMSGAVGLSLMSILADTIAGHQKKLVTDAADSYSSLQRFITRAKRGQINGLARTDAEKKMIADSGFAKLVSISMLVLNTDEIEMDTLIALREREYKNNDTLLRELRHRYYSRLESVTNQFADDVEHEDDFKTILSDFYSDMEADLVDLKRALKIDAKNALLSKEVLASFLAPPVLGIAGGLISTLGVYKALGDYREARRKTLLQHPMAWLYMTKPSRLYG